MNNFKQYKFNSHISSEILEAAELFGKLGYTVQNDNLDILQALQYEGICTWDDTYITEGYLFLSDEHEDITLEELKNIVRKTSLPSGEIISHSAESRKNNAYDIFVKIPNKDWKKLDGYSVETYFSSQYKYLIGVQFAKTIYPFKDNHYVHNIIRDKDGDVCVVDQYGVDYKLRDVEFYVSDEHDGTATYNDYVLLVNT